MAVIYGEGQLFFDIRKKSFCEQLNALDSNARQKVLEEYADWNSLSDEDKQYFLNAEIKVKAELLLNEDDLMEEDKEIVVDISVSSEFDDASRYFYFTEDDRTDEEIEELRRENEKAIEEYERKEKEARVDELTYGRDDDY